VAALSVAALWSVAALTVAALWSVAALTVSVAALTVAGDAMQT